MSVPFPVSPNDNRFALVTPDDHSAPLIIVIILSLIFSALVLAVRILIVKWKRHSADDSILGVAYLVALAHWISMFIALNNGLGKALRLINEHDQDVVAKAAFAGRILLLPTLCLSKISVLVIIRHLFHYESKRKLLVIDFAIAVVTLWGLVATIALVANCSPYYLLGTSQCPHHPRRIKGVLVTEIFTEAVVFILSPLFLYSFDVALNTKMLVVTAFSFRLPLIPLSTFYLLTQLGYLNLESATPDTVSAIPSLLLQEILLAYALMSATIPCLKSFVQGFTTGGVGYVIDPNAGRVLTVTDGIGVDTGSGSEESYEMGGVDKSQDVERASTKRDSHGVLPSRAMSKRLSRAWNGGIPKPELVLDSQTSETPMIKKNGYVQSDRV